LPNSRITTEGHVMEQDVRVLKQRAQIEAERLGAFEKLHEITDAIDLAAFAVIGMAKELGGEEGQLLANYLRELRVLREPFCLPPPDDTRP
jgi:hypothetical protein